MNSSLTFTRDDGTYQMTSPDPVLVLEVLGYEYSEVGGGMATVRTSRGEVVRAFVDELTIWNL